MGSFTSVRSLERGLKILEALNRCHGTKAQQLARMVELPRPTVYRLLETMEGLGYVTRSKSDNSWNLTAQVKSLSSGFHDDVWVTRVAAPILHNLGRELLWPLDLVTFENDAMIIRESTHAESPFSIDRGMAGAHLPILQTSGGRTHLAFSAPAERDTILERLRRTGKAEDALAHDVQFMERLLTEIKQKGYGFRTDGFNPHTASISVPILGNDRVLACITVIWIASALSFAEAVERNLLPLKRATSQIEAQLRNLKTAPTCCARPTAFAAPGCAEPAGSVPRRPAPVPDRKRRRHSGPAAPSESDRGGCGSAGQSRRPRPRS